MKITSKFIVYNKLLSLNTQKIGTFVHDNVEGNTTKGPILRSLFLKKRRKNNNNGTKKKCNENDTLTIL